MADTNLDLVIRLKDEASASLKTVGANLEGFGNKAASFIGGTLKIAAVGATAAIGGLTAAAYTSVQAFNESAQVGAQLEAVLKSTKGAAGLTKAALEEQATALMNLTGVSDEAVKSSQAMLLTFTNIKGGVLKDATSTVLDMATAMNSGLTPSAEELRAQSIQLGKALNDPINGITALTRVGVTFTDKQKEQIAALVESGHTMEAQKLILAELSTEFGGSAKAAGETFAGQLNILKQNFGELQESIGGVIVEAIGPFVQKIADFVKSPDGQKFTESLIESVKNFVVEVGNAIRAVISFFSDLQSASVPLIAKFKEIWVQVSEVAGVVWEVLRPSITFLTDSLRNDLLPALQKIWDVVGPLLIPILKVLGAVLGAALIGAIEAVSYGLGGMSKLISFQVDIWSSLVDHIKEAVQWLNKVSGGSLQKGYDFITNAFGGGKAVGGPVGAGTTYLVGENGPELFTPGFSGNITPNNQLGAAGQNVSVNIYGNISTANGPQDVKALAEQISRMIQGAANGI